MKKCEYLVSLSIMLASLVLTLPSYGNQKVNILFTGFQPFGFSDPKKRTKPNTTNRSELVLEQITQLVATDPQFALFNVQTVTLPVLYQQSFSVLKDTIDRMPVRPHWVISLGAAPLPEEVDIRLEFGAQSLGFGYPQFDPKKHSRLLDNNGQLRPANTFPFFPEQESFKFPVQDLLCELSSREQERVAISFSPGQHVCNDLSYSSIQHFQPKNKLMEKISFSADNLINQRLQSIKNNYGFNDFTPRFTFIHVRQTKGEIFSEGSNRLRSEQQETRQIATLILTSLKKAWLAETVVNPSSSPFFPNQTASDNLAQLGFPSFANQISFPRLKAQRDLALRSLRNDRTLSRRKKECYTQVLQAIDRSQSSQKKSEDWNPLITVE